MRYARRIVLTAAVSLATVASADTFSVTNIADSGAGSLRDAIISANATPGDDTIRFSVTGVLTPSTPYPATVGKISIDGNIPASSRIVPVVEIDAAALSEPVFRISSDSTLHGFTIHGDHGAAVEAGAGAIIVNCFIGTDAGGNTQIPNATGIVVTGPGVRLISNLISGNTIGVEITGAAGGTSIYDNRIGVSFSGTYAIPNGVGVSVSGNATSAGLAIGVAGIPNTISGNTGAAIRIASFNSVTITGNYIGVADYTGKPMGNGGSGIELSGSSDCTITDNVISNNGGTAIWIGGGSGAQNHNRISKNTLARNGFGIDLGDTRNGHTANDSLDTDSGPNALQNHPVITLVIDNNTSPTPSATVNGTLSSAPNSSFAIELFVNTNCLGGDYGAAETYLTTLNLATDSSGNASFSSTFNSLLPGMGVAATATDAQGNTSEVSNCSLVRTHGKFGFLDLIPIATDETAGKVVVTVSRKGGDVGAATVSYTTAMAVQSGFYSATAGSDYAPTSGTLSFADGETSKTFTVPIFDDKVYETNEILDVTLSNPTGGATLDFPATLRLYILDDETQSKITIADTSVTEGNSGTTYAHVPVTITPPAGFPVSVSFAVGSAESATAGEDYQQFTGSLTFEPGEGTKTIDIPIVADTKYEQNEVFGVSLISATPVQDVTIKNYGAHVTIVNDDIGKVLCIPAPSITEGSAGTFPILKINCTGDSPFSGGVYYLTANGTAIAGEDYSFSSGSIVFNPGFNQQTFSIPIIGDDVIEPNEQFTINLRAEPAEGWNFIVEPAAITATILNDDTPGVVRCNDALTSEGNSGMKSVEITCSSPTRVAGTIDYTTANGTAVDSSDYSRQNGTITFNDETRTTFTVSVVGDTDIEADEQFTVNLTAHPSDRLPFTLARDSVSVTIQNDDQPPPAPTLVLAPGRLTLNAGDTAQLRATIEPPLDKAATLTVVVQDRSIADAPATVAIAPGQPAFIPITAKKRGATVITVSAGTETVGVLFVEVTEGTASLTSVEPASGPNLGGANVTLRGTNLSSGCVAWFGGIQATSTVVNNGTTATVVAPPHAADVVDFTLTCGSATITLPRAFTYIAVRGRAARH